MIDLENVTLKSPAAGTTWYFSYTGSSATISGIQVQDSNASVGNTIDARGTGSVDAGDNTNWIFATPANFTWIGLGADNNWSTTANWQGNVPPGPNDTATFGRISTKNSAVNVSTSVGGIQINIGYSGTLTQNSGIGLTIGSTGYTQVDGNFAGGDSAITVNGPFTLTSGSFQSTSGNLSVSGNWNGNMSNANGGNVTFFGAPSSLSGSSPMQFWDVTVDKNDGAALTLQSGLSAVPNDVLTLNNGKTNQGVWNINVGLTFVTQNSGFDGGTSTVSLSALGVAYDIEGGTGPIVDNLFPDINTVELDADGALDGLILHSVGGSTLFTSDGFQLTVGNPAYGPGYVQLGGIVEAPPRLILRSGFTKTGGTFDAPASTIAFIGTTAQQFVSNTVETVAMIISSNTSVGGVTFSQGFNAGSFALNASALGAGATAYFAGNSTFTIGNFSVNGTPQNPVTLLSTTTAVWYLNNTTTNTVNWVQVQYSSASAGKTIVDTNGTDLLNNTNWTFSQVTQALTWTGAVNNNFAVAGNWNLNFVPRAVDDVVIPLTSNNPILDKARTINSLNVNQAGAALDLDNFNLTVSTYVTLVGTLTARGSEQISVGGNWDNTSGWFNAAQSTLTFVGSTTLTTGGDGLGKMFANVIISTGGRVQQSGNAVVTGNWINSGVYVGGSNSIVFSGSSGQRVDHRGQAFGTVLSSNTSSSGLTFVSSFTTPALTLNATALSSSATMYFSASASTFTISTFTVVGSASHYAVLKSTASGQAWSLNNTSSNVVSYAYVQDSDASTGKTILCYPGCVDGGHNVNWIFDPTPTLASPTFLAVNQSSITAQWNGPSAATFRLQVSTNNNFGAPVTSSDTALRQGTTSGLLLNTTYFFQVASQVNGTFTGYLNMSSTSTLAAIPSTAASTWTAVNYTSVTVNWLSDGNPGGATLYEVRLGTSSNFSGIENISQTYSLSAIYTGLVPSTTYYGRVRAINNNNVPTTFLSLGSTVTIQIPAPTNLTYVAASTGTLTGTWTQINPPADTYTLEVSTAIDFSGTLTSSATILPPSTVGLISPLLVNTTYYGRVKATLTGVDSPWSASATTATLANIPATTIPTWTSVFITSVTVNWSANGNPSGTLYDIALSTDSAWTGSGDQAYRVAATNYQFLGLSPNTTYYSHVRAINRSGIATTYLDLGSTVTIRVPIPSNFRFTSSAITSLTASWTASTPSGDNYIFQVSTASDMSGALSSTVTANTNGTVGLITPLLVNTTYYGQVAAVVAGTTWTFTNAIATATLADIPATVVSTWTAVNFTSITVTWDKGTNPALVTHYEVRLGTASDFSGLETPIFTDNLSADFTSLVPNTTYYGRVRAINHSGIPTTFLVLGSTRTQTTPTPTNLIYVAASTNTLTGTWTPINPPADTYTLEVSTAIDFSGTLTSSTTILPPSTVGLIAPLLVNTTYYGQVKATINGSDSAWSVSATTATLADIPATVVSTWTAVNFTSITVTWDKGINPALVTHYEVRLGTASDFSGLETPTATDNLSADFISLVPNTIYYGRVRAINHSGIPTAFLVLGSTRTQTTPTPTNLIYVAASTNTLTGTWTPINPSADTYTLEVSTAIDFSGTLTSSTTIVPPSTVGLIAPLLVNTTYYGQVKATINGGDSAWSASATTATLADVPATVVSTWTAVNFTSITVTWDKGTNPALVTHYEVRLGTASDFSGLEKPIFTDNKSADFTSMVPNTTYKVLVRAINKTRIPTTFLEMGSTLTQTTPTPTNLSYTSRPARTH